MVNAYSIIGYFLQGAEVSPRPFFFSHINFIIMPKIRLSALAADMKGKLQGSVFSSNSGGVYFRNNPSGGGRKSQLWSKQKNKFSQISSQWRSLTEEQRDAWETARSLYPTTNAFGEPRIPTAYELYMRLNSALYAQGFEPLKSPNAPRPLVTIPDLEFLIPDAYVFTPRSLVNLQPQSPSGLRVMSNSLTNFYTGSAGAFHHGRFSLNKTYQGSLAANKQYPLFSMDITGVGFMSFWLIAGSPGSFQLAIFGCLCEAPGPDYNFYKSIPVPADLVLSDFTAACYFRGTKTGLNSIYINGECLWEGTLTFYNSDIDDIATFLATNPPVVVNPTPANLDNRTVQFFIGSKATNYRCPYNVSDFRFITAAALQSWSAQFSPTPSGFSFSNFLLKYNGGVVDGIPTATNSYLHAYYAAFGYILGCETILVGMDDLDEGTYANYGTAVVTGPFLLAVEPECTSNADCTDGGYWGVDEVECVGGVCVYVGEPTVVQTPSPFTFGPLIFSPAIFSDTTGKNVVIQFSVPQGTGRAYNNNQYVDVFCQPLDNKSYFLGYRWKALFANCPGDSATNIKVYQFDSDTGSYADEVQPVAKPKKNSPRFKPGAELSGKVN